MAARVPATRRIEIRESVFSMILILTHAGFEPVLRGAAQFVGPPFWRQACLWQAFLGTVGLNFKA
jgi:hypothetical protein